MKDKVKTALDETRMLMLGSQILLGFQLNGIFQSAFEELSFLARSLTALAVVLMAGSVACLVAPAMQHRLVERGNVSGRLQGVATRFAGVALLPLSVSLGTSFFVALERQIGRTIAAEVAAAVALLALTFWFGIERFIGGSRRMIDSSATIEKMPLHDRIEQMLTEARILLPGAQALLGFQFAVMLTNAFDAVPEPAKIVHIVGLLMIAFAVILLITPAAIHRISFGGEDTEVFYRIGSGFVIAASGPLGLGIACDVYVVVSRAAQSPSLGIAATTLVMSGLAALWWVIPIVLRARLERGASS